mmetsp:Transcript_31031/g.65853  ORF Transcript_31031/g.65853 Transcript_31031/m.65853 type:complete len:255 (+) Transcript_31031:642-1406(+)
MPGLIGKPSSLYSTAGSNFSSGLLSETPASLSEDSGSWAGLKSAGAGGDIEGGAVPAMELGPEAGTGLLPAPDVRAGGDAAERPAPRPGMDMLPPRGVGGPEEGGAPGGGIMFGRLMPLPIAGSLRSLGWSKIQAMPLEQLPVFTYTKHCSLPGRIGKPFSLVSAGGPRPAGSSYGPGLPPIPVGIPFIGPKPPLPPLQPIGGIMPGTSGAPLPLPPICGLCIILTNLQDDFLSLLYVEMYNQRLRMEGLRPKA